MPFHVPVMSMCHECPCVKRGWELTVSKIMTHMIKGNYALFSDPNRSRFKLAAAPERTTCEAHVTSWPRSEGTNSGLLKVKGKIQQGSTTYKEPKNEELMSAGADMLKLEMECPSLVTPVLVSGPFVPTGPFERP